MHTDEMQTKMTQIALGKTKIGKMQMAQTNTQLPSTAERP